jgi:hypothetical protein
MEGLSELAYDLLLAYGLPGAITVLIYGALLSNRLALRWDLNSAFWEVLGFVVISIVVGLLLDMISAATVSKIWRFQQKRRDGILFGVKEKRTLLWKRMNEIYPDTDEGERAQLVYAIFNAHVQQHIYSRRNWDWFFFMASRSIFVTSYIPLIGLALLAWQQAWQIGWNVLAAGTATLILFVVYHFMMRQLEIYYGYYANVALGHLLHSENLVGDNHQSGLNTASVSTPAPTKAGSSTPTTRRSVRAERP